MTTVTLKGNPVQILGKAPQFDTKAPSLTGVDIELKDRSLAEFEGQKKIVCFVPSLDTAVCSQSAQTFNKKVSGMTGTVLIYCSMDLPFALQRACGSKELYGNVVFFSLFRNPEVAEGFGARLGDGPLRGLCARAVFVLDGEDKVVYYQLVSEITNEPDYEAPLRVLTHSK